MFHRILPLLASAAILVGLAGCDAVGPEADSANLMSDCLPYATAEGASFDDTGCGGGGGGGGTGGGGTTTTQYRMVHGGTRNIVGTSGGFPVYKYKTWTYHQVLRNGSWEYTDGRNNGVVCRYTATGQVRDSDIESNASKTTMTFTEPGGLPFTCEHSTTSPNGQVHTATTNL